MLATMLSFIPFGIYVTLPANPMCGPLRSMECAVGFYEGNVTSCIEDILNERANFDTLGESLMPREEETINFNELVSVDGNATSSDYSCDSNCVGKNIFAIVVNHGLLWLFLRRSFPLPLS